MQIHGLNAVVTGGGSGLGEATARALASAGSTVTLLDLARSRGQEIAEELGADAVVYQTVDQMEEAVRASGNSKLKFCKACFEGTYPTGDITEQMLSDIEQDRVAAGSCK